MPKMSGVKHLRAGTVGLLGAIALAVAIALAGGSAFSATTAAPQASTNVVLIPGLHAPRYSDSHGIPPFPASDPQLAGYHYSELPVDAISPEALQGHDTVVLYGLRWSDLSAGAQAAVNAFARTGKVVIWDADSTPSQNYGSFVVPFTTSASGEGGGSHGGVVTFPAGSDPLASSDAGSPLYLDPAALVASTHLIGHMNVLNPSPGWAPALIAANTLIPAGGWVVGWGYGSTPDRTGMVIYSGMDADAFTDAATPNYAVKELAIELAAPFQRTPDTSCAPGCGPPQVPPTGGAAGSSPAGGTGPSTGGNATPPDSAPAGLGAPQSKTFAACALARPMPSAWVRGRIFLSLSTSVAAGIHAKVTTLDGKLVGSGVTTTPGHLRIAIDTRLLLSDRRTRLTAAVYVNAVKACSVATRIAVDNRAPRLRIVRSRLSERTRTLTLRASETAQLRITSGGRTLRRLQARRGRSVFVALPRTMRRITFTLVDRAGNRSTRTISWH
jgi:hypothetical protein